MDSINYGNPNFKIPAFAEAASRRQANVKGMSRSWQRLRKSKVEAKVEKKLNLSLNLNLHEVRKPQP